MVPPIDRAGPSVDPAPLPLPPFSGTAGTVVEATPSVTPPRIDPPAPVRTGPRFMTPPSAVRPPYPESKISSEEEATLRLRLAIDERGRVIRVDPVGAADPAFLAAARRHLIARWRYQPATEDGRAVVSTTVITLRFQLDG